MIRRFLYEEDGIVIDLDELQRVRYEFLLRKKDDAGLNGAELKEIEANHYAKMIRHEYMEALYGKMMLLHMLKGRSND